MDNKILQVKAMGFDLMLGCEDMMELAFIRANVTYIVMCLDLQRDLPKVNLITMFKVLDKNIDEKVDQTNLDPKMLEAVLEFRVNVTEVFS